MQLSVKALGSILSYLLCKDTGALLNLLKKWGPRMATVKEYRHSKLGLSHLETGEEAPT